MPRDENGVILARHSIHFHRPPTAYVCSWHAVAVTIAGASCNMQHVYNGSGWGGYLEDITSDTPGVVDGLCPELLVLLVHDVEAAGGALGDTLQETGLVLHGKGSTGVRRGGERTERHV